LRDGHGERRLEAAHRLVAIIPRSEPERERRRDHTLTTTAAARRTLWAGRSGRTLLDRDDRGLTARHDDHGAAGHVSQM
jgi:hypothetical protein